MRIYAECKLKAATRLRAFGFVCMRIYLESRVGRASRFQFAFTAQQAGRNKPRAGSNIDNSRKPHAGVWLASPCIGYHTDAFLLGPSMRDRCPISDTSSSQTSTTTYPTKRPLQSWQQFFWYASLGELLLDAVCTTGTWISPSGCVHIRYRALCRKTIAAEAFCWRTALSGGNVFAWLSMLKGGLSVSSW